MKRTLCTLVLLLTAASACVQIGGSDQAPDEDDVPGDDPPDDDGDGEGGDGDEPVSMDLTLDYGGYFEMGHGDGGEFHVVDLNADQQMDFVLVASNGDGTRRLYPDLADAGTIEFSGAAWSSPLADPSDGHHWMFADVDRNGRQDFIETTRNEDGTKEVFVSLGSSTKWTYVGSSYHHDSVDGPIDYRAMDIDGDGREDWVQIGQNGDGTKLLSFALAVGTGSRLTEGGSYVTPVANANAEYHIADIDDDGYDDWIDLAPRSGGVDAYVSLGSATGLAYVGQPAAANVTGDIEQWLTMDVDGDGADELVALARDVEGRRTLQTFFWSGSGLEPAVAVQSTASFSGELDALFAVGDVNGDGKADLVEATGGVDGVGGKVFASLGSESGFVVAPTTFQTPYSDPVQGLFAADVDGDGRTDLVQYQYRYDTEHHHGFHVLLAR